MITLLKWGDKNQCLYYFVFMKHTCPAALGGEWDHVAGTWWESVASAMGSKPPLLPSPWRTKHPALRALSWGSSANALIRTTQLRWDLTSIICITGGKGQQFRIISHFLMHRGSSCSSPSGGSCLITEETKTGQEEVTGRCLSYWWEFTKR